MSKLIAERWEKVQGLSLKSGAHSPDSLMCVMEAVAFVAGEKWSDHPTCTSKVISAFLRSWNDALPTDADRNRLLKPLIPKLIGTKDGKRREEKRAMMAADWLIRVHTPAWLRLSGLEKQAQSLESLPEVTRMAQIPAIRGLIEAVRDDARAAWAAARDAAGDAAWHAAGDAAGHAAWAAAGAAAGDAARKKLAPTVEKLQQSALELIERMIAA
jgi:hypothetical protein